MDVELRQECALAPPPFMNWIDRRLGEEYVMVGSGRVSHLLFADKLVLLSSSAPDFQHALEHFAIDLG